MKATSTNRIRCSTCGEPVGGINRETGRYCPDCRTKRRREQAKIRRRLATNSLVNLPPTATCAAEGCDQTFKPLRWNHAYCCERCQQRQGNRRYLATGSGSKHVTKEKKSAYNKTWWENNPDKARAARIRGNAKRQERVTKRRLDLLEAQGFKCAICRKSDSGSKRGWHLDHDHKCCPQPTDSSCGKCDRGVLCHFCNTKVLMILERYGHLIPPALVYLGIGPTDIP